MKKRISITVLLAVCMLLVYGSSAKAAETETAPEKMKVILRTL